MPNSNKPQLIVLTPVRNEAWILRAFLTATSLWADKIIIADQMSTDGSRDIYKDFPKVIVFDNERINMHQAATRRLLFDKARKVLAGNINAILFALDTDEFLCGDFLNSEDWKKIINSKPNDTFSWRWMNLKNGDLSKYSDFCHYYWAVHVSDTLWDGLFPDEFIHEWRLPWPKNCTDEQVFLLDELRSIHFARVNVLRQRNKERFYQVSARAMRKDTHNGIFYNYMMYHTHKQLTYHIVPTDAYDTYRKQGIDILSLIDFNDDGVHYTKAVIEYFKNDGMNRYALLDIWDQDWCEKNGISSPQRWYHRLIMKYLKWSNFHPLLLTKILNKCIKKIEFFLNKK